MNDRNRKGQVPDTNPLLHALNIGFYAGLIWWSVKLVEFCLKFTKVHPGFLIKPFVTPAYLRSCAGFITGWIAFILFSMLAAILYTTLIRKAKGPWPGLVYGLSWWGVLYLLIGPSSGMMRWIYKTDWNTVLTDLCLFLIWGLFIGYSITLEFTDERVREPDTTFG